MATGTTRRGDRSATSAPGVTFEALEPRLLLNGTAQSLDLELSARENVRDLTGAVDSSQQPAWVRPGSSRHGRLTQLPVTVANTGNVEIRGRIVIDLYASTDQELDKGTDTKIASQEVTVRLEPGESGTYRFSILDAPELAPGSYYLVADIDALDAVAESDETNNAAAGADVIEWDSEDLQKGVSLPLWDEDVDLGQLRTSLGNLKALGVNWVAVNVFWFQDTITSTVIQPDFDEYSASDASVRAVIDAVHNFRIKVMLKPLVNLAPGSPNWRGQIVGSEEWFTGPQGYGAFINHWAEIAQEEGVDMFCVGTELVATTGAEARWRAVIAGVEALYSGPLVYAANHGGAASATQANIAWWDALDYIGLDAYYPLTGSTDPSVAELRTAWATRATMIENWRSGLDPADQKPVLFTEIGYRSWDGANQDPASQTGWGDTDVDQQEQADCYQATYEELWRREPWLRGMYWWNWEVDPNPVWEADNWYTPQGKPAQNVIGLHYMPDD